VVENHSTTDAAPEALYWAGVARYKAMNDPTALSATAEEFRTRYSDTSWAKKASVWEK
jgi:TolA-binding protein